MCGQHGWWQACPELGAPAYDAFSAAGANLNLVIGNAAIMACPETRVGPGWEAQFATNHLGHYALVNLLWPAIARGRGRVVAVSSAGHRRSGMRWDDVMFERGYDGYTAYARSKLAQVLFTLELTEQLAGRDITVNALHPATLMDTKMVLDNLGRPRSSVEEGGEAVVRLVADPDLDGVTARFFDGTRESAAHGQAYDAEARRRLWEESQRLTRAA